MESHASSSTSAYPPADLETGDVEMQDEEEPMAMVDPATGQKILRPRNAWILYRKTRLDDVPPLPDGSKQPMAKASSIISHWWKTETKEVRRKFELMAATEKAEHKRRYPDYKYKPRSSHQIALAKEKKKAAKKIQAAKEKESKKAKPVEQPHLPLTSMAHTSYIEAALAAQSVRPVATHGPGGPSPPLSLTSSPTHAQSPLPLSEFEQGSSSTPATSHQTPSPGDMLGLSLAPPSFNFSEQKPSSRAPRHLPARLPPRLRTKRQVSGSSTAVSSRVPSSSSLVILSPATSTSTSLSPLAWPPTSQYPSPQSGDESLASDLVPRSNGELYWGDEPSASTNAEGSGSISIDLDFNPANSGDLFGDLEYFNSMGLAMPENNEGVFQVPAAPFLDIVPGQIDVNLVNNEVSDQDRERFASLLNDFDFSAFQQGEDATFGQAMSEEVSLPDGISWDPWNTIQQQPAPEQDSSNTNEYHAHPPTRIEHAGTPEDHLPPQYQTSDFGSQQPAPLSVQTFQPQNNVIQEQKMAQQDNMPQGMAALPLSPEVLADPEFQAMVAGYLERKQKQGQQHHGNTEQSLLQPAQQYASPHHLEQVHHPQPQYAHSPVQQQQQYQQQFHSSSQQPEYRSVDFSEHQQHYTHSQSIHHTQGGASESPSAHAVSTSSPQSNRWVPPPGAIHAGNRRVAGSWRPPLSVEQEAWSVPPSPVECAPGSHLPSWAGVPN